MKNESMDFGQDISINRNQISNEKLSLGSTIGKYPVNLNDGRTVVYISDKSKEAEIRLKYEMLKDKKYPTRNPKHYK